MILRGQMSLQRLHPRQRPELKSITFLFPSSCNLSAPVGQNLAHIPQPSHPSPISTWAKGKLSAFAYSVAGCPKSFKCSSRRVRFLGNLGSRVTLVLANPSPSTSVLSIVRVTISHVPFLRPEKNSLLE